MKIVVIGGTGLIGSKLVALLRQRGQEVLAASPNSGVNTVTGEGLAEALAGAQVVVDVANSPSFEDTAVMKFFQTAGHNLLGAEAAAGVRHHIALSIVGADRLPDSGYLRAKVAQENLIKSSGIPYTILRSTQFFEFGGQIADAATDGNLVRVPDALIQPIVSDDVVAVLAEIALAPAVNGTVEVGGPERFRFDEFMAHVLGEKSDQRKIVADLHARYFGTELGEESLVPVGKAHIGQTRYDAWSNRSKAAPPVGMSTVRTLGAALVLAASAQLAQPAHASDPPQPVVAPLMLKDLADVPGKEMIMITVDYPPGAVEHVHRHDGYAFVYVLEGSIIEGVRGGKEVTLTPGQTFYEGPTDVHTIGRNASKTKPAKFVVVLLKKKGVDAVLPAE